MYKNIQKATLSAPLLTTLWLSRPGCCCSGGTSYIYFKDGIQYLIISVWLVNEYVKHIRHLLTYGITRFRKDFETGVSYGMIRMKQNAHSTSTWFKWLWSYRSTYRGCNLWGCWSRAVEKLHVVPRTIGTLLYVKCQKCKSNPFRKSYCDRTILIVFIVIWVVRGNYCRPRCRNNSIQWRIAINSNSS